MSAASSSMNNTPRICTMTRADVYAPADRHLADMVDDHPLESADVEGLIPEDSHGARPVVVWDLRTVSADPPSHSRASSRRGCAPDRAAWQRIERAGGDSCTGRTR
jgi:hypothetical protein